ncbi:MAG: beta-phosphoglucomutase family hydrolase [Candidatus Sungiibacteriota bacterium]
MTLFDKTNNENYPTSAVIFDVDGVLVNTVPLHFRAWQRVFADEGISFGKEEYQLINGIPRDEGIRITLGDAATPDHIRDIGDRKQNYYLALLNQMPPQSLPGIKRLLRDLRKAGLRVAAASSSKNAIAVLAASHLTLYFDAIITGYDFQRSKPDPDIFLTAARALRVESAHTVVVEDAANGVRAALAGGFRCIAVATSESADALRAAGALFVAPTTNDLTIDVLHI